MEILMTLQVVICVVLILGILLQPGSSGLGTVFGGSINNSFKTRRGIEAFLYNLTIFLGILLVANSIAIIIVKSV
jgi:preprotein translocase subunit SecG